MIMTKMVEKKNYKFTTEKLPPRMVLLIVQESVSFQYDSEQVETRHTE